MSSEGSFYEDNISFFQTKYDLEGYDLDDEMKDAISMRLSQMHEEDYLDRTLVIASLFMLIRNGWKLDPGLSKECKEARNLISPFFQEHDKRDINEANIDRCLIRYCKFIYQNTN